MRVLDVAISAVIVANASSLLLSRTAQTPASAAGTGSILGTIIDVASQRGVRGVNVTLTRREGFQTFEVITDSDGRFAFLDLPKGTFTISADKPGFSPGEYGKRRIGGRPQVLSLADDQHLTGVSIPIWKYGVITGTVVDEAGEPMVGLLMQALPRDAQSGRQLYSPAYTTSRTDDRGMYRLSRLTPGEFVVVASFRSFSMPIESGKPDLRSPRVNSMMGDLYLAGEPSTVLGAPGVIELGGVAHVFGGPATPSPGSDGRMPVYQTTYFPATTSIGQARLLTLDSGQELSGIDFQLRPVPTRRVSGTVTGPTGPMANVSVHLVSQGSALLRSDDDTALAMSDARGDFVFPVVPRGAYTLRVLDLPTDRTGGWAFTSPSGEPDLRRQMVRVVVAPDRPTLSASVPITVADRDITDLAVMTQHGARLSGRIVFDRQGQATPPRVSVQVNPADGYETPAFSAVTVNPDNTFQSIEFPPGRYFVTITPPAPLTTWSFMGAVHEGRDISIDAIEIDTTNVEDIVITVSDHASEVRGTVRTAQDRPDADASVLVFPADNRAWVDTGRGRQFQDARVSADGIYVFRALPPGDYFIVAVDDERIRAWQAPGMLEALSRVATRVRVNGTDNVAQDLRTSVIR